MIVEPCTVSDLWAHDGFRGLLDEYAEECLIEGMPTPKTRMAPYRQLEEMGLLSVYWAKGEDDLYGFISVLLCVLPHYGIMYAISESFFVSPKYRKSGAGLALLRQAEGKAKAANAPGLLVSAPYEGDLYKVLPHRGYKETNRIFFKSLHDA